MKAAEFIRRHPWCCFCGGTTPAASIEHQPAKILFRDKHRPKGLEFPSCDACNEQTSGDECVLALVARLTGSLRFPSGEPDSGLLKAIKTIKRRFPSLFDFLYNRAGLSDGVIDLAHPQISESMCRLAAKISLPTLYVLTDKIAGSSALISTNWAHHQLVGVAKPIDALLGMISGAHFLRQGAWNTMDTFYVKYFWAEGLLYTGAVAHESVALFARMDERGEHGRWEGTAHIWSPASGSGIVSALNLTVGHTLK